MLKQRHRQLYSVSIATMRTDHYSEKGYEVVNLAESGEHYNDAVFMRPMDFKAVYSRKKSESSQVRKRLSIVKITPT